MEQFESESEILEFAIGREITAYQFYTDLARQMEKDSLQALFERLAKDELRHRANLELEMMKLGKTVSTQTQQADLEDTAFMVVAEPGGSADYKNALMMAVQKEKLSFRLYCEFAGVTEDLERKEMLLSLAEEEARHIVLLELEYGVVSKDH